MEAARVRPRIIDLGSISYADAYALQCAHLEEVLAARDTSSTGDPGRILLVEHAPAVITVTRRPGAAAHLIATPALLAREHVEVVETDRGGDITYHGPGQLVVYPIIDLNRHHLRLHAYMRLLEQAVIDTLAQFGITATRDTFTPPATGVWVPIDGDRGTLAKICAMGVRVRRWVSMHGLALNVTTNLDHFKLIVPCGLSGRPVTSMRERLGPTCPPMAAVKDALAATLATQLVEAMNAPAVEEMPDTVTPSSES